MLEIGLGSENKSYWICKKDIGILKGACSILNLLNLADHCTAPH